MEDLEIQAVRMEQSLQSMMEKYYQARTIITTKKDIINNKDAIIAGLRAQLNHSDEDDDDDSDNDDVGDEAGANTVEEEPNEREFEAPSDEDLEEEYTQPLVGRRSSSTQRPRNSTPLQGEGNMHQVAFVR